ncbi:hypothetical protein X975_05381, partial [Stegodyphus mimosarum]
MHDVEPQVEEAFEKIKNNFEEFLKNGSGWVLEKIKKFELNVARYELFPGSSYIPLPKKLADKKAILNIQNYEDDKCFVWCLIAHKMNISRENQ